MLVDIDFLPYFFDVIDKGNEEPVNKTKSKWNLRSLDKPYPKFYSYKRRGTEYQVKKRSGLRNSKQPVVGR